MKKDTYLGRKITYTIELFEVAGNYARKQISCKEDIPEELIYEMFGNSVQSHEELHAIYLNNAKELRYTERIATGTLNACLMNFDKIMTTMAIHRMPNIILIHNHPSGYKNFSSSDYQLKNRVDEICKVCGFTQLDFLMVDTDFNLHSIR